MSADRAPQVVCSKCRRPLARHEFPDDMDQSYWDHELHDKLDQLENGFTHTAVPVEVSSQLDVVGQCDFCSATPESGVQWSYPAADFEGVDMFGGGHRSIGDWAACDSCSVLIESNNRAGLVRAVTQGTPGSPSIPPELLRKVRESTKRWHNAFFSNRIGERQRLR